MKLQIFNFFIFIFSFISSFDSYAYLFTRDTVTTQMWNFWPHYIGGTFTPGLNMAENPSKTQDPISKYQVFSYDPKVDGANPEYIQILEQIRLKASQHAQISLLDFDKLPDIPKAQALMYALSDVIGKVNGTPTSCAADPNSASCDLSKVDSGEMSILEIYRKVRDSNGSYTVECSQNAQLLTFILNVHGITAREWVVGDDTPKYDENGNNLGADNSLLPSEAPSLHGTTEFYDSSSGRWVWIDLQTGIAGAYLKNENRFMSFYEWVYFFTNPYFLKAGQQGFIAPENVALDLAAPSYVQGCLTQNNSSARLSYNEMLAICPYEIDLFTELYSPESNYKTITIKERSSIFQHQQPVQLIRKK